MTDPRTEAGRRLLGEPGQYGDIVAWRVVAEAIVEIEDEAATPPSEEATGREPYPVDGPCDDSTHAQPCRVENGYHMFQPPPSEEATRLDVDKVADDVRHGGKHLSSYWEGWNDGIDALAARLTASDGGRE